jgi:hypothetical protein
MNNSTKTLTWTLVFAVFSALLSVGCTKAEPPKPAASPNAPKMAPGQAEGMYYMQQHGGNPQAGQGGR